jgi:hypothetical protein
MPGWTVGDKRVPPFRAPAFGDPVPFDDEMGHAAFAQVLAHRQPSLAPPMMSVSTFSTDMRGTSLRCLGNFSRCAWKRLEKKTQLLA